MLDNETLTLLAKLKVAAKKTGADIDLIKMSNDKAYAADMLNQLSNYEDIEIVSMVINLMNKFGIISAPSQAKTAEGAEKDRYIGRLR